MPMRRPVRPVVVAGLIGTFIVLAAPQLGLGLGRVPPAARLVDLLLFLAHQPVLHRVVGIVVADQPLQLQFFGQGQWWLRRRLLARPRSLLLLLLPLAPTVLAVISSAPAHLVPLVLAVVAAVVPTSRIIIIAFLGLVARMIDTNGPPENHSAPKVVDGQGGAALVLVLEEGKALGLARVAIADELDVGGLAVLREDGDDVALAQLVGQPADVDVGGVAPVLVPGRRRWLLLLLVFLPQTGALGRYDCSIQFSLVQSFDLSYVVHLAQSNWLPKLNVGCQDLGEIGANMWKERRKKEKEKENKGKKGMKRNE